MNVAKYFARFGKVYGPFNPKEVEDLHASGKIREYFWVWSEEGKSWIPMDPAPAPLHLQRRPESPTTLGPKIVEEREPTQAPPVLSADRMEVVCHNKHQFLAGRMDFITQTGCELVSTDRGSSPVFPADASVLLNILHADTQEMLNIKARISGVARTKGGWTYQIRWDAPPDFKATQNA